MGGGKVKAYHTTGDQQGTVAWQWQGGEVYDVPNMMHSGNYEWLHDRSRKSMVALDPSTGTEQKSIEIKDANISCQWSVATPNNLAVCDISWVDLVAGDYRFELDRAGAETPDRYDLTVSDSLIALSPIDTSFTRPFFERFWRLPASW